MVATSCLSTHVQHSHFEDTYRTSQWLTESHVFYTDVIFWNTFLVVLLNFPLMILTQVLAWPHHMDHASSYHHGNQHAKCSLCRHWSTGQGHTLSLREGLVISVLVMALLFKSSVKCVRVALPLMLILLSGDVETNPGPYGKCPMFHH